MQWPNELFIDFSLALTKEKINNLLVNVDVVANKKNNYSLGDFLTDGNGKISLKKEFIENKIQSSLYDYPMDYSDRLGDLNKLKITIETREEIMARIQRGEKYYPEYSKTLLNLMNKAKFIIDKEIIKIIEIDPNKSFYKFEI